MVGVDNFTTLSSTMFARGGLLVSEVISNWMFFISIL